MIWLLDKSAASLLSRHQQRVIVRRCSCFAYRHFTAILILAAIAAWGFSICRTLPPGRCFRLKQAIDARDGNEAARYVDFQSVVQHAGYEMVHNKSGTDPLSNLVGKAAVDLFTAPMAGARGRGRSSRSNDGQQGPADAGGGRSRLAIVLCIATATPPSRTFTDNKGQAWEIHLARGEDGAWRVTEIKDIEQLLEKLQREQQKRLNAP